MPGFHPRRAAIPRRGFGPHVADRSPTGRDRIHLHLNCKNCPRKCGLRMSFAVLAIQDLRMEMRQKTPKQRIISAAGKSFTAAPLQRDFGSSHTSLVSHDQIGDTWDFACNRSINRYPSIATMKKTAAEQPCIRMQNHSAVAERRDILRTPQYAKPL